MLAVTTVMCDLLVVHILLQIGKLFFLWKVHFKEFRLGISLTLSVRLCDELGLLYAVADFVVMGKKLRYKVNIQCYVKLMTLLSERIT